MVKVPRPLSPGVVTIVGVAVAVALSLTVAAQTVLSMRQHGHSFARIFIWQLACWTFWAIAAPLVLHVGSTLPTWRGGARRYAQLALLGLLLTVSHAVVAAQFSVWVQPFTPVQTDRFGPALVSQLGLWVIDLPAYAILLTIGGALTVYDRARQLEIRESRLEAQLARANLDALRLEIQPHFLFNTLNTIAALIRRQSSTRALDMLVGLSDLMRGTLQRNPTHLTALDVELAFVQKYVDLYRVRFSDRLEVSYEIEPATTGLAVPTFILQPLVENAFRHGIADQPGRSHVEIGARLDPEGLRLWVADDGAGVAPDFLVTRDAGTGLGNVRSRIESLFGPAARMEIRACEAGATIAAIVLPAITASAVDRAAS